MSDLYSLGGGGNASVPSMSRAQPARAVDTTFLPSAARPTFVQYTVQCVNAGAADDGQVTLLSDAASPPTTVLARARFGAAQISTQQQTLTALIMPGHNVRLATSQVAGTPALTLVQVQETTL